MHIGQYIVVVVLVTYQTISYNEKFHNLFFLPNIIKVVKKRKKKWVGHVGIRDFAGKYERKRLHERSRCNGKIILKWNLKN
jgi:hypothetical protein